MSIADLITGLRSLSKNLWWTWNSSARDVLAELSPLYWSRFNHNAVEIMARVSEPELTARLSDPDYAERVADVLATFNKYLGEKKTWASEHAKELTKQPIAYFSAEFGLHESLQIYSGGLGVLAGDHIKSASDLGLNFAGVSLFYREGYFQQRLSADGWQQEVYPLFRPDSLAMSQVIGEDGKPVTVSVELGQSVVHVQAWAVKVGRATLYLLDTNIEQNEPHYRDITSKVYGGDATTRINQEIILGIGGVKFLHALGLKPAVYHMNEGHSGFLTLELVREQVVAGKSLDDAKAFVKAECIFTTHTPVPAGHDRFSPDLMGYSLGKYAESLKIDFNTFMALGREHPNDPQEHFTMTVLCLNLSRSANGVSELHGEVSRDMWRGLYGNVEAKDVPIGYITNGIHTFGWLVQKTERFWLSRTQNDREFFRNPERLKEILDEVSDEELWSLRYRLKRDLMEFAYGRLSAQYERSGQMLGESFGNALSPDVLTIGFARRFATYKRAPLVFSDIDRITRIISNSEKPVQFFFAGKAHPRDDAGKKYIQQIVSLTRQSQFLGKVVFIENYDMNVARHLISGVDVWLNNPMRPLEASGTSGQKVIAHGGLNCSILDGWWREAYNGENGWSIGKDENHADQNYQDSLDANSLYDILEQDLVPTYYNRTESGIPTAWLKKVRNSMLSLMPVYNTHRMVSDYVLKYYKQKV
ncbi:MAG: alpha-glucan family phosphorylase [Rhizobacter sp.]|nr:alpha-glucan family phosphorylase [Chlorobiales bacterium]